MVSPEVFRRYPFFGPFNDKQLRQISMISEEVEVPAGTQLFEECQTADTLFLLIEGEVELYYKSEEEFHPKESKEFAVGIINPGEVFAVSSLISPYVLNATGRTTKPSRYIKIDAKALRELFDKDPQMGYKAMHQVTKTIMERLSYTRAQLAAAWA